MKTLINRLKTLLPIRQPQTHFYTDDLRTYEHQIRFNGTLDVGKIMASGFGPGIKAGDFILAGHKNDPVKYRVDSIKYLPNRENKWEAILVYIMEI